LRFGSKDCDERDDFEDIGIAEGVGAFAGTTTCFPGTKSTAAALSADFVLLPSPLLQVEIEMEEEVEVEEGTLDCSFNFDEEEVELCFNTLCTRPT
jgi:hypothetical protein